MLVGGREEEGGHEGEKKVAEYVSAIGREEEGGHEGEKKVADYVSAEGAIKNYLRNTEETA